MLDSSLEITYHARYSHLTRTALWCQRLRRGRRQVRSTAGIDARGEAANSQGAEAAATDLEAPGEVAEVVISATTSFPMVSGSEEITDIRVPAGGEMTPGGEE